MAVATNILPGPVITSTLGMVSVPYAIAPIADAPPTLKTCVTLQRWQAARSNSFSSLSGAGVQITISSTPATCAGITFISNEEGYAAFPPGIYSPALSTAVTF